MWRAHLTSNSGGPPFCQVRSLRGSPPNPTWHVVLGMGPVEKFLDIVNLILSILVYVNRS
jgi:hypothetical protein